MPPHRHRHRHRHRDFNFSTLMVNDCHARAPVQRSTVPRKIISKSVRSY